METTYQPPEGVYLLNNHLLASQSAHAKATIYLFGLNWIVTIIIIIIIITENDSHIMIKKSNSETILESLSTRDFETRTASGSELFSLIICLHAITFILLSTFPSLGMISIKMCETPLSWHKESSLPVAVRVSKTRVLKLPNSNRKPGNFCTVWFS